MTDTKYVCKFERIGRNHHVPDLSVVTSDGESAADQIAAAVSKFARKHLNSSYYCVDVELADDGGQGAGFLDYGRFGKFSIEAIR